MQKWLLLFILLLTSACAAVGEPAAPAAQDLQNRSFKLLTLDGRQFTAERDIFIVFDYQLKFAGRVCNNFAGQARLRDNILYVDNLLSTKMLCLEEALSQTEIWLGQMLADGAQVSLRGKRLMLQGQGHTFIFEQY